ncbi:MAG: transposase [Alistipes senegalensis]|nr:transposase [Alistipes senegalensis]
MSSCLSTLLIFFNFAISHSLNSAVLTESCIFQNNALTIKKRCSKAGIFEEYQFRTKTQMALEMIKRAYENGLPFEWATGDSVYGADSRIQKYLEEKWARISTGIGTKGEKVFE